MFSSFSNDFGWSEANLIKKEGDVYETLYLLFNRDAVPPKIVMYGQKDQTHGSLRKKYQEAD